MRIPDNLLAIETSGKACSATVIRDGMRYTAFTENAGTHSSALFPHIQAAMKKASLTPDRLTRLAVSAGPGSFTGIRIGVAAAKGIAFGRDLPCTGISSLEASLGFDVPDGIYCSLTDARHQTYYWALFQIKDSVVLRLSPDTISPACEIEKKIPSDASLIGEGRESFSSLCPGKPYTVRKAIPTSEGVARAALVLPVEQYCSAQDLEAIYLRLSQAEQIRAKQKEINL